MKDGGKERSFFDWEQFQKQFRGDGRWHGFPNAAGHMDWVEDYVRSIVGEALPDVRDFIRNAAPPRFFSVTVFETHHLVIARIKLLGPVDPYELKFFVGQNELVIEGLPDNETEKIVLPANVRHAGSKVVYKDKIFEVRMPKMKNTDWKEIPVTFY